MARGAKPGERRGGRKKGVPNKATIEKALIAEKIADQAEMRGEKLAKEYLNDFLKVFAGMASFYQPAFPGISAQNPNEDEDQFTRWADRVIATAKELAKYQSPQLRSIEATHKGSISVVDVLADLPEKDLTALERILRPLAAEKGVVAGFSVGNVARTDSTKH